MEKDYVVWKIFVGYLLVILLMTLFIDIQKDATSSAKYKIVVIPTILIFNGDEEVGRFQANIMMQMEAKQKDIQDKIDEIIMELF